jgi:tetratricopeptide (TPR) repeat protein
MEGAFKAISDLFQPPASPEATEARAFRRRATGKTPDESDELGRQSLSDGDLETAIRHFREAVAQRDPKDVSSRIDLAGALETADYLPQAYRQYEKALQQNETVTEPLVGISDLLKRYGRFRDAAAELEKAIEREPHNAFYRIKLAELLRESGERRRALAAALSAVAVQPDEAFFHYWIGDLLIELGRYEEALDSLRAAIELSPGDDFYLLRASVAFWNAGKRPEAVKALRLASDLDPSKNLYHGLLEELLTAMDMLEEAALETERASMMDGFDEDHLDRLLREMKLSS